MNEDRIDTIIGDDIVFKGSLKFSNSLKVKGQFKGTIESDGELYIGETGEVEADILIVTLGVSGSLRGNVEAKGRVDITKSAVIVGDIKTPMISIEPGGKFTGNCVMNQVS